MEGLLDGSNLHLLFLLLMNGAMKGVDVLNIPTCEGRGEISTGIEDGGKCDGFPGIVGKQHFSAISNGCSGSPFPSAMWVRTFVVLACLDVILTV